MKLTKYFLLSVALLSLTACAKKEDVKMPDAVAIEVGAQKVSDSKEVKQEISFSALVTPEEEAQIVAKANGTVQGAGFKVGDKVKIGDQLLKIDDVDKANQGSGTFNANAVKQAQLAAQQAYANLALARTNYQNILLSADKDLKQAEIAKDQASSGKNNTNSITSESMKSAQLAYETAKAAAEQARLNLENQKNILGQQGDDSMTNAETSANTVANTCDSIIAGINNITSLDEDKSVDLSYETILGVLDTQTLTNARLSYNKARQANDEYKTKTFATDNERLNFVSDLAQKTKRLTDDTKLLFAKTITSATLPLSSLAGTSLTSLQSQVGTYQAQASAAIGQINGAKQSLQNTGLSKNSTLDNLTKVYELAQKQVESASQNLNNLNANTNSQKDQAGFGADSAANQYENAKIKIGSQMSVSKSQMDMASIQYQNALVTLESLYDSHLAISPIAGTITKKMVDNGSTVSAGQLLAVVARTEKLKIQFYVDQENLAYLKQGQSVSVRKSDGQILSGKVWSFSMQADAQTRRFQVEVRLDKDDNQLIAGTVVDVILPIVKKVKDAKNIILPLSAVEIGQNQNFIMIIEGDKAKKMPVEVVKVEGEAVEVKVDLPGDVQIIIDGNKLLEEGDLVKIKN